MADVNELISKSTNLCSGCAEGTALHLISKACPKNVIVSMATGCTEVCTTPYPFTSWKVPAIHAAFETSSSVASGIEAAVKKLGKDWKVMALAGDGGTADIGLQALSGMLERGQKVTQIMFDNEAYMNTGIQRSGSTPYGAWTTTSPPGRMSIGKGKWKKPIVDIIAAHKIPYVATASVAFPSDLITKVKKAFDKQPSFVQIHCPCPVGWKFDSAQTINIGRSAVETGMWALYEIEDGIFKFTKRIAERKPIEEYLKLQGRFKHLPPEEIKKIQKYVDSEWNRFEKTENASNI